MSIIPIIISKIKNLYCIAHFYNYYNLSFLSGYTALTSLALTARYYNIWLNQGTHNHFSNSIIYHHFLKLITITYVLDYDNTIMYLSRWSGAMYILSLKIYEYNILNIKQCRL